MRRLSTITHLLCLRNDSGLVIPSPVGVAMLKSIGANDAIMSRKIFEQEQIARAVELNLGVASGDAIDLVTGDPESASLATTLKGILAKG